MASTMGKYETHITVSLPDAVGLERLQEWAVSHGLKCVHIMLDRGAARSQPMLTRHGWGQLSEELAVAAAMTRALAATGFPVTRMKLEAAPESLEVPRSSMDAEAQPPDRYFEHHVKLLLTPGADTALLRQTAERHSAHLSHNALKQHLDGCQERFVTQRCRLVSRAEARQCLDALLAALAPLGHPTLDVEEEFVVYDSNLELDAGWIQPRE